MCLRLRKVEEKNGLSFSPPSEFQTPISSSRFPSSSDGKASVFNVGDPGLIPELGHPLEKEIE